MMIATTGCGFVGCGPADPPEVELQSATATKVVPRPPNAAELDPLLGSALGKAIAAVDLEPHDAAAWGRLGRLYEAHDFVAQADQAYREATDLDPQEAAWPYSRARFASQRGEFESAKNLFETVLRLTPDYPPAYYQLGSLHLAAGELPPAERAYTRLLGLVAEEPWGHLGLGTIAWRREDLDEATTRLEHALDLEPTLRDAHYLLAMTHRARGDDNRARELLEQLGSLGPPVAFPDPLLRQVDAYRTDLSSRVERAMDLKAQGRPQEAAALYRSIIAIDADHFDAHHNLGVLYAQSGNQATAEEHLEKARTLRPGHAGAHFNLAILYLETDRPELAIESAERALAADPRHTEAQRLRDALKPPARSRVFR